MIALIQRVKQAEVKVNNHSVAKIGAGMLVFLGICKTDEPKNAAKLQKKLLQYRIFADQNDKMNKNIGESGGEILLISQFTLAANTNKGNRPSFDSAMPPAAAEILFNQFYHDLQSAYPATQCGIFGADMQVSLINDGPVTFWLEG